MPRHLPVSHSDPHRKLFPSYPSWNYQQVCRQKTQWLEDYNNFPSLGSRDPADFSGGNRTISEVLDLLICAAWAEITFAKSCGTFLTFSLGNRIRDNKEVFYFRQIDPRFFFGKPSNHEVKTCYHFWVSWFWSDGISMQLLRFMVWLAIFSLQFIVIWCTMHPVAFHSTDANKMMPHGPKV